MKQYFLIGNNKKYVKTVIGIYIVFVVIYPIISKVSGDKINIESIINNVDRKVSAYSNNDKLQIDTNKYIEETYKKKIEDDIKNSTKDNGYVIYYLDINIETENEGRYGQIKSIKMGIDKFKNNKEGMKSKVNNVYKIEEVKININDNNYEELKENKKEEKPDVTKEEIDSLKQILSNSYGIDIKDIYINE